MPTPVSVPWAWASSFPVWQMNGLVPELLDFVGASQWCFTLPEAMVVVGWPALVSVAGVGRVKKGMHEGWGRD